jgi:hypothetical protein
VKGKSRWLPKPLAILLRLLNRPAAR